MIRALLSLWSPSDINDGADYEVQNRLNQPRAQSQRQIRGYGGMRHQNQGGYAYPRYPGPRHHRMIAFELAVRQNLSNLLDQVEPNNRHPHAGQIQDMSDSEPDEGFFLQRYGIGYSMSRRRNNFTMPRIGLDEPISQPIVWLAVEALEKRSRKATKNNLPEATVGHLSEIEAAPTASDFVAQFLVKHLTIDVFNAGNQPGYGPSNARRPPPPPPPPRQPPARY